MLGIEFLRGAYRFLLFLPTPSPRVRRKPKQKEAPRWVATGENGEKKMDVSYKFWAELGLS